MPTSNNRRLLVSSLLDLAQAYRQTAILTAACQLDVFNNLANGPLNAEALAQICGVPIRGLQYLLNACVIVNLVERKGDTYCNTPIADALLVEGRPGYMGAFVVRRAEHYKAWGQLAQAIRQDRPVDLHSADALDRLPAERMRYYIESFYDTGKQSAEEIVEKLDLTHARQMLDVAGGPGIYSIIFAQHQPALRAIVFDLQPTLSFTEEIIARHGMATQVSVRPGNYLYDKFGRGYDILLFSNVLNMQGPKIGQMLLLKAFHALAPSGQLVVHGVMPTADRVSPPEPALYQVQMFLQYPEGDAHPAEDVFAWAKEAGFIDLSITRFAPPNYRCLVTGRKPV